MRTNDERTIPLCGNLALDRDRSPAIRSTNHNADIEIDNGTADGIAFTFGDNSTSLLLVVMEGTEATFAVFVDVVKGEILITSVENMRHNDLALEAEAILVKCNSVAGENSPSNNVEVFGKFVVNVAVVGIDDVTLAIVKDDTNTAAVAQEDNMNRLHVPFERTREVFGALVSQTFVVHDSKFHGVCGVTVVRVFGDVNNLIHLQRRT